MDLMTDNNQNNPSKARNLNLDLIKLLSCVAVVMIHCVKAETLGVSMVLYQLSIFAVPCFFMASGYLLLNKSSVTWNYVFRKILGICRLVVIWNAIYFGCKLLGMVIQGAAVDLPAFLLSFVTGTVNSVLQRGDLWQLWYLGTLGLLYLILPLLHRYLRQNGRRTVLLWGALMTGSALLQAVSVILGRPLQNSVWQTFRLWTSGQYFLLGALIPFLVVYLEKRVPLRAHGILTAAVTAVSLLWRLMLDLGRLHWTAGEFYYDDPVTILWIGLLFSLLMRAELSVAVRKLVSHMAPLSMGVYIIHVPVRNLIRDHAAVSGDWEQLLLAATVGVISFLLTYLIRKLPFGKHLLEI